MQSRACRRFFLRGGFLSRVAGLWLSSLLAAAAASTQTTSQNFRHTDVPNYAGLAAEAKSHVGNWIWASTTSDKQTVHLWKSFEIPHGAKVAQARLWITADNGYRLYLDGRQIGRGSDWRWVTEYDVTRLLRPGKHVLAVEAFNDALAAGLMFGLQIDLSNQPAINVVSDGSWRVAPLRETHWQSRTSASADWPQAKVVGKMGQVPWVKWPVGVTSGPTLQPIVQRFWQSGWFQALSLSFCILTILACLYLLARLAMQSKAHRLLHLQRARIARDIHDDLGARLTELLLVGEVAQSEQPADSQARLQFNRICERARDLAHAMDEVVWAINSRRDTLRDFVSYVCKYAQLYLSSTPIRCRLDVEAGIPAAVFDLPVRRNLLLAVKEALNNAVKYSGASELFLRIYRDNQRLVVVTEDNGRGFDPARTDRARNGMTNMSQRMREVGGSCSVASQPGGGCRVAFIVPLHSARRLHWFRRRSGTSPKVEAEARSAGALPHLSARLSGSARPRTP